MLGSNIHRAAASDVGSVYPISIPAFSFDTSSMPAYGPWVAFPNVGTVQLQADVVGWPTGWIPGFVMQQFTGGAWVDVNGAAWDEGASSFTVDTSVPSRIAVGGEYYGVDPLPQTVTLVIKDITTTVKVVATVAITCATAPA